MRIWRAVAEAEYRDVNHSTYSTLFLWDSGTLGEKKLAATRLALDPQAQSLLPVGIYRWIPYSSRFIQCRNGGKRHLLINPCSLPNKFRDVHDSFGLYVFTSIGIETRDHQLAGFKEDLRAMAVSAQSLHFNKICHAQANKSQASRQIRCILDCFQGGWVTSLMHC